MAAEVPDTPTGRRIYYERVHCLLALASAARRTDPASIPLDEPPAEAERDLGHVLGQAFHQGCSIADAALATGLPTDRVVAIGKRTIRRAKWLSRVSADPVLSDLRPQGTALAIGQEQRPYADLRGCAERHRFEILR